jgi:hypothetical protein
MDNIIEYLNRTKSAVSKLFEAYNSYWELLKRDDDRLYFYSSGDINSEENKLAYEKWRIENKEIIEADLRRQNEFAYIF